LWKTCTGHSRAVLFRVNRRKKTQRLVSGRLTFCPHFSDVYAGLSTQLSLLAQYKFGALREDSHDFNRLLRLQLVFSSFSSPFHVLYFFFLSFFSIISIPFDVLTRSLKMMYRAEGPSAPIHRTCGRRKCARSQFRAKQIQCTAFTPSLGTYTDETSYANYNMFKWNICTSKVPMGHHLSDMFSVQNDLKQWDALLSLLFNFGIEKVIWKFREIQIYWNWIGHVSLWSMLTM
jgi:hypothetical protein